MSMMNGLVSIDAADFSQYFEKNKEYYYLFDLEGRGSFVFNRDNKVVAYKDKDGECFSRSCYWRVE